MSAHIDVNGSDTRLNGELRQFIDALQRIKNTANEIKAGYDQLALGGDWVSLGAALGLSAGDAETVYNLVGSVQGELNGPFVAQMLSRMI